MLGDDRAAVPGRTSSGVRVTTDPDQQVADDLDFDRSHPSTAAVGLVGPLDQSAGDDLFGEVADTIPVQTGFARCCRVAGCGRSGCRSWR
jgi:hypothetical protein